MGDLGRSCVSGPCRKTSPTKDLVLNHRSYESLFSFIWHFCWYFWMSTDNAKYQQLSSLSKQMDEAAIGVISVGGKTYKMNWVEE